MPASLPIFKELHRFEPRSMAGQPPIIWHKADNFTVSDKWGNRWIDWSSGVLITNAGHGRREIIAAIKKLADRPLLATYVFVHEDRAMLTRMLREISPDPKNYQAFLLSTGSEADGKTASSSPKPTRCKNTGRIRNTSSPSVMHFTVAHWEPNSPGGNERLKTWMVDPDRTFVQVPFPDGYKNPDTSFDLFLRSLAEQGIQPQDIAGVMSESYQGVGPDFLPVQYAKKLAAFCPGARHRAGHGRSAVGVWAHRENVLL